MTYIDYKSFAINYSPADFEKIKFDWNGQHGDDFEDKNYQFRSQLCEAIHDDLAACKETLILDLFLELSKCAKETFGVYLRYHKFANELLERTGIKYFEQYMEGASQSMDTGMSSGLLNLSEERLVEILNHVKSKLAKSPQNVESSGYEFMLHRFENLYQNPENAALSYERSMAFAEKSISRRKASLWSKFKRIWR